MTHGDNDNMNTLFKLPGGRSIPMQRAIKMGLADAEGQPLAPARDSRGAALLAKEQRAEQWKERQSKSVVKRKRIRTGGGTQVVEPALTVDGKMKRGRKQEPEPLKPQNVKDGQPITDEETLAEIAAKTAEIERAKGQTTAAEEAAIDATAEVRAEVEAES